MDTIEQTIRLFRESLFSAFYGWLEANKEAIGEKWYHRLRNEAVKADADTPIKIMGTALWMFNMIANFGVFAGISPPNSPNPVNLQHIDERLDKKTTKRLLLLISSCLSLQYLPRDLATKQIPVITARKFSLKLYTERSQT